MLNLQFSSIFRMGAVLTVLFALLMGSAVAQSTSHAVTFSKFTVQEGAQQESSGKNGLRLKFDVAFNWEEVDFFAHSFQLSFRMEKNGQVVMRSSDPGLDVSSIQTTNQTVKGKPGMVSLGKEVFIPYSTIPLESGPQAVELIFSMANEGGTYSDCHRATVNFTHKKIVLHNLNQQGFTFSNLKFNYAAKDFSSGNAALQMNADVAFKYGPGESVDEPYEVYWLLRTAAGKVAYDSRKSVSLTDRTRSLRNEIVDGKAGTKMQMMATYYEIDMEGTQEAEVVIVLQGTEGGPKEIFNQKMQLNIPPKYNFETQGFTLNSVSATATKVDGVGGIQVNYSCGFKQTGTLRNPEKGKYFFYAVILDAAGKVVIAPERAPTQGAGTTHLQDGHMPAPDHTVATGTLFIPSYLLTVPAGKHDLRFALMVSDVNLETKFPLLGNGAVTVVKPAEVKYMLSLERLDMISANYDSDIVGISSPAPELQYVFAVGDDKYYASEYDRNSLSAIPGSATLRLCEGDPISMLLYDVDSGFFNDTDLLGKWKIDYAGKGDSFSYNLDNAGQVVALRLKIVKQ